MTVETFVGSLSQSEKLLAMELIWQDLSNNAADLPSPNWHDAIVHKRLDNPRAWPRWVMFIGGTLISIILTVGVLATELLPDQP